MSSATTDQSGETIQRDWEAAFESLSMDPGQPQSSTQVRSAAKVSFDAIASFEEADDAVADAIDSGQLVQQSNGVVVAGYESDTPNQQKEEKEETATDSRSPVEDDTAETGEVPSDIVERLEALEEQNKQQAEDIARLKQKNNTLTKAIAEFAQPDKDRSVVGELPEAMRGRAKKMKRTSKTVSRVNDMLDDLDDMTKDKQQTTDGRVYQLRRHLVSEAEKNGGRFAMDYKAVQTFFNAREDDGISSSWASQLQTKAADGHHAFEVKTEPKRIAVEIDKIDEGSVYRVKNSGGQEGE